MKRLVERFVRGVRLWSLAKLYLNMIFMIVLRVSFIVMFVRLTLEEEIINLAFLMLIKLRMKKVCKSSSKRLSRMG